MSTSSIPLWLRGSCVALVFAAAAGCGAAIDRVDIEAAQTAARVTTALVNDPTLGTRAIDVRVEPGGIVQLSGVVQSEAEAARAVDLARAVAGVTRVESSLKIGVLPTATTGTGPRRGSDPERDLAAEFAELETTYSRLAIGGSVNWSDPGAGTLESRVSVGPLIKIGSGTGLGPAIGFDWFRAKVAAGQAPGAAVSGVNVRPVMAGLSYTFRTGRVSVSPSLVGGYAINTLTVPDEGAVGRLAVDIDNSLAWRPAVSVWIDTSPRTALNLSLGRVMTRLQMTFVEAGHLDERRVSGDTTVVHLGFAYRIF